MNKTSPKKPRKARMFPTTLGETIGRVTKPLMKKRGLPDGLLQQWEHIAGKELADYCTPLGCKRSKRQNSATLTVEVAPSHNLLLQHHSGVLLERINMHYGYQVFDAIQQKPMTESKIKPQKLPTTENSNQSDQFAQLLHQLQSPAKE